MLTKCPECGLQISNKALTCPHCGYPLKPEATTVQRRSSKRKRLPNGFGQIALIKGQGLRKPYRVMITIGKTETGKPICKLLKPEAYFETYNDAYAALLEYNRNPYDISADLSVEELYNKWTADYFNKVGYSTVKSTRAAWLYCKPIKDIHVREIRARHIKNIIDTADCNPSMKARIKILFNKMLDYGVEYEIIDRNYARAFAITDNVVKPMRKSRKGHIAFSNEEIEKLWNNVDVIEGVDIILTQCYSGWRPQELGLIRIEDVNLENWTFKGGIKTDNGKDRTVPIHSRIRELVERNYIASKEIGFEYLFRTTDNRKHVADLLSYKAYFKLFLSVCDALQLDEKHRPHDGRKHFVTMAKKYKVDEYAIKYIVGHAITDVTELVYTERSLDWLAEEMEKIR